MLDLPTVPTGPTAININYGSIANFRVSFLGFTPDIDDLQ